MKKLRKEQLYRPTMTKAEKKELRDISRLIKDLRKQIEKEREQHLKDLAAKDAERKNDLWRMNNLEADRDRYANRYYDMIKSLNELKMRVHDLEKQEPTDMQMRKK